MRAAEGISRFLGLTGVTSRVAARPRPLLVTRGAPHLRDAASLGALRRVVIAALLPCLLMGLITTGRQAGEAMAMLWLEALPGWRGWVPGTAGEGLRADLLRGALYAGPIFAVALATGTLWRLVFARLRRRPFGGVPLVTALVFTLVLPPGAPLWQVALGMSFGLVVGKEIFGGTGRNFVHPALAGLVFLYLAYPDAPAADPLWEGAADYGGTPLIARAAADGLDVLARTGIDWQASFLGFEPDALGTGSALACLIGALVLVLTGAASWRIMAAVTLGGIAAALTVNALGASADPARDLPWQWHLTLGSFAFGAVFLATEPASAPATNAGRWIAGLLIGAMAILVRVANPAHPDGVMMAVLLGNVFTPLIDTAVIRMNMLKRARRHV